MIRELITYCLSQAVPGARSAGLVREVVAIKARHRRHASDWALHLEQCKSHIIDALKRANPLKPVLVLGAGPCLDLPIKELAAHPAGATLVDAVLLPSTKRLVSKYPNLKFKLSDISGALNQKGEALEIPNLAPIDTIGYGLIISANILSQLPLSFISVPAETEEEKAVMTGLQVAHMESLKISGIPVLIISDYEAISVASNVRSAYTTIDSVIFSDDFIDSWKWPVAPLGEISPQIEVCLEVGAWQLNWEFLGD